MVGVTAPESPLKKRKWYLQVLFFLLAFWWGYSVLSGVWQRAGSPPSTPAEEERHKAWARASFLQQELSEIRARPNPTVDDYIKNTLETAPLIDEAKALIPFQRASAVHLKEIHPDNSADVMAAEYGARLVDKGEQLLYLMGNEVDCARALEFVPKDKRSAYYQDKVSPLKDKERQVGKEFYAIVMEGQAKGVPWPDSMVKSVKVLK